MKLKIALNYFTTPQQYNTSDRERMLLESMQQENFFIDTIDKEIKMYTYGYSSKRVLLVHGWSGSATKYYKLADKLLENGFMVISFDAPAHGQSIGKTTDMSEFTAIIDFLNTKFNGFHTAIGHSLGAMALLQYASNKNSFQKLISIGATNYIDEIVDKYFLHIGLSKKLIPSFKTKFEQQHQIDLEAYNASALAKNIKIPTLIVHDTTDKQADVSNAHIIRQNLTNGSLLITNGNGHLKILIKNTVLNKIIDFIILEK